MQNGVPDCGGHEFAAIRVAAQAIAAYRMGGIYGPLASVLTTAVQQVTPKAGGRRGEVLDRLRGTHRYANCVAMSVVIPSRARIVGIQYQASDRQGSGVCIISQDCQIGSSRFDPAQFFPAGDSTVVTSLFRNWSGDRTRNRSMTVYFIPNPKPPAGFR